VTGDGRVTGADLGQVARQMGKKRQDLRYDVNGDGRVSSIDLSIVARAFGRRC
jgi:hypothetical protein